MYLIPSGTKSVPGQHGRGARASPHAGARSQLLSTPPARSGGWCEWPEAGRRRRQTRQYGDAKPCFNETKRAGEMGDLIDPVQLQTVLHQRITLPLLLPTGRAPDLGERCVPGPLEHNPNERKRLRSFSRERRNEIATNWMKRP
jgi:hypothetical protein